MAPRLAAPGPACHRDLVALSPRAPLALLLGGLSALAGCASGPTRADALELLRAGRPAEALVVARAAAEAAGPEEAPELRRLAIDAGLLAGWSHEAARDYVALRALTGRDDPGLLLRLGREALGLAAGDADPARRVVAAACAAWCPAGDELARQAARDPLPEVRGAACAAAAHLPTWSQVLQVVGEPARQDPDPWVRGEAVRSLAQAVARRAAGDPAPQGPCLALAQAALADPDEGVRALGVELLAALVPLARPEGLAPLSQALLAGSRGASPSVRALAARALAGVDPDLAREAAGQESWASAVGGALDPDALRASLAARPYEERLLACRVLRGAAAGALLPELLRLAESDPVTAVRAAAVEAVASAGEGVAPHLRRLLGHAHPSTRRSALQALARRGSLTLDERLDLLRDEALAPELAPGLAGSEEGQAALRALVLGPAGTPAYPAALRALVADPGPGAAALRPRLLELLLEPEPDLAALAARGLAGAATAEDRAALVGVLTQQGGQRDVPAAAALLALEEREQLGASGLPSD